MKSIIDRANPNSWPYSLNRYDIQVILGVNANRVLELFHREDFPKIVLGRRFIVTKPAFLAFMEAESKKNK